MNIMKLVNRKTKNDKNYDTSRSYASFSLGSNVAVKCKDGGPCTYSTMVGRGDHNHSWTIYHG